MKVPPIAEYRLSPDLIRTCSADDLGVLCGDPEHRVTSADDQQRRAVPAKPAALDGLRAGPAGL